MGEEKKKKRRKAQPKHTEALEKKSEIKLDWQRYEFLENRIYLREKLIQKASDRSQPREALSDMHVPDLVSCNHMCYKF